MHYIDVQNLSFYYDDEPVLENITYHIDNGEFVILTGENGAAKSTLIKATLGLLKPEAGTVTLSKINSQGKPLRIGYIPQQVASFNAGFPSTVLELVKSGRYPRGRWFKPLTQHDLDHVEKALKAVDMWEMRFKKIGELSGGQKQRVSLARVFVSDPDLFILDEPTTGMDEKSRHAFYELMQHNAHQHDKAILMITHDHEDLKGYFDRHIHLVRKQNTPWRCFQVHTEEANDVHF
ncbi:MULTISPECIES: metal ABC transporter ATP-binding protein [unclassified Enterococcus]|uniref:metal ABC transporter ATP-binding protein n=1 Tax=unclassified Enterococcus TaxID=2608891 RepID=UPI0015529539|nr:MULTISPECIES: metal ABC transporter ATP-binding protein [unclassified Enterococcus]MBS7577310.1 metal ABC transporter ATP-binding protein [Enterococcus sp. MMGLQ5-2]MBS7584597.1 metal ABC transporter ATP-binding protein [Enterococcus sp. MMGLQ5-1]NPD12452.1 metal ABC transporter ATP-binding protein [Enterococcus sp. MMGLQ5-1]NPD37144.1 metal ABC transporter ATP-binding protein [Enterococcus sp. MMGLQ5-2]